MSVEIGDWKQEVQDNVPHRGTTTPLSFSEAKIEIFDREGRPLSEDPRYNPAHVTFIEGVSNADDERQGKSVNVSAFRALAPVFPQALRLVSYVRNTIKPYGKKATGGDIKSVLNTLISLPRWMVLNIDPIENGEVPVPLAAAAKAARGAISPYDVSITADLFGLPMEEGQTLPLSTQAFMDQVHSERLLIAYESGEETDRACPASEIMIVKFATALFEEPSDNMAIIGDQFGLSRDKILDARKFGTAFTQGKILEHARKGVPASQRNERRQEIGVRGARGTVDLVQVYPPTMNGIQERMNKALGRQNPPLLTEADIFNFNPPQLGAAYGIRKK